MTDTGELRRNVDETVGDELVHLAITYDPPAPGDLRGHLNGRGLVAHGDVAIPLRTVSIRW